MSAKYNLLKYLEIKNEKKPDFYRKTGLSNGFLDKNEHISSKNLEIIISIYQDLNLYWLVTGKGDMFRSSGSKSDSPPTDQDEIIQLLREKVADQQEIIDLLKDKIELLQGGNGYDADHMPASAAG